MKYIIFVFFNEDTETQRGTCFGWHRKLPLENLHLTNIPCSGIIFLVCHFSLEFKLIETIFYRYGPKIDILELVTEHIYIFKLSGELVLSLNNKIELAVLGWHFMRTFLWHPIFVYLTFFINLQIKIFF